MTDTKDEPKIDDTSLGALTGAGLEALGHAVTQAEGDVSGPVFEIENRLRDMTVGEIARLRTVAEGRRNEITRELGRRTDDINRVIRAISYVLTDTKPTP